MAIPAKSLHFLDVALRITGRSEWLEAKCHGGCRCCAADTQPDGVVEALPDDLYPANLSRVAADAFWWMPVGDDRRRQQLAEARLLWTMPLLRARFIARRSGFGTDPHVLSLHPSGVRDA
jgi:hypothetical protein